MIPPDWIWAIARFAIDTAPIVLWDCFEFLAAATPLPLRTAVAERLSSLSIWCIAILGTGLLTTLAAQIAVITGRWSEALDPETVGENVLYQRPSQEDALAKADIMAAVHQLPEEQRSVLLLISVEDLSYAQVAEVLAIPIGTVTSRLSRGRERLRHILEYPGSDAQTATYLRRVK